MATIYLVRHGETLWNREKRLQGHIDVGLNENGLWQASRVGEALAKKPLAAVVSSDLSRASQTASAIAAHHGLELKLDSMIRERHYGIMQGLSHQEVMELHPRNHAAWKNRETDFRPENGESLSEFYARIRESFIRWARLYEGQEIAVVAHGGVLDCVYRMATAMPLEAPRNFEILNASLNTIQYQDGGFALVEWGDVSFLKDGSDQSKRSLDEVDGSPKWA